jgi:hypothetical protein
MVQSCQKQEELTAKNDVDRDWVASNEFFVQCPISYATLALLITLCRPTGLFVWQISIL